MVDRPKRRKSKDNPYTLIIMNDNKYFVSFKDGKGIQIQVEVSKEVFDSMDNFELEDISQMHKIDRHLERNEVYDETLNSRILYKPISLEDEVIRKSSFEDLRNAINELPEMQKRRIKKYYFEEMTQQEIADSENITLRAVQYSLSTSLEELRKKLNKF